VTLVNNAVNRSGVAEECYAVAPDRPNRIAGNHRRVIVVWLASEKLPDNFDGLSSKIGSLLVEATLSVTGLTAASRDRGSAA
jgi:hypothetical protein